MISEGEVVFTIAKTTLHNVVFLHTFLFAMAKAHCNAKRSRKEQKMAVAIANRCVEIGIHY